MLSFPETPTASPVELVSLTADQRGFVFEYSPGPTLRSYSPLPTTVTALLADAIVDVSALDTSTVEPMKLKRGAKMTLTKCRRASVRNISATTRSSAAAGNA